MDRRELLDRAAHSPEERLLLSRVWDKCEQWPHAEHSHGHRLSLPPGTGGGAASAERAGVPGGLCALGRL